jgi:hypothetical protein
MVHDWAPKGCAITEGSPRTQNTPLADWGRTPREVVQKIDPAASIARVTNGWQMNTDTMGVCGDYYLKRAIVAMIGLGANQVEDAIYPLNVSDADGKPVTAENNYVLHFGKDQLPPVGAFWSLTLYDAEGFQVANPLNRFAIGDRDFPGPRSLSVLLQRQRRQDPCRRQPQCKAISGDGY